MHKRDVFSKNVTEILHNMTLVSQSSTGRGIPDALPRLLPLAAAPPVSGNGAAEPFPAGMDEKTQEFWRGKLATATFGGIVGLLMRSPAHKHFTLPDLEWYLLPPLALGQFLVGETRLQNGQALPLALVLWARVSAEVAARLSAETRRPVRLQPSEWQSGDVYWIVDAVGEPKAVQECIEALKKTRFPENLVKRNS